MTHQERARRPRARRRARSTTGAPYMVMEYLEGSDLGAAPRDARSAARRQTPSTTCSRRARPSPRRTRWASSTATSSRRTCSSRRGRDGTRSASRCSTSASRRSHRRAAAADEHHEDGGRAWARRSTCRPSRCSRRAGRRRAHRHLGARRRPLRAAHRQRRPSTADTLPALRVFIAHHAHADPQPAPGGACGLEAVAACCLQKNREQRYPNVAELAQALAPFAPERSFVSIERASRILNVPGGPASRFERTPPKSATIASGGGQFTVGPEGPSSSGPVLPWRQTATASNFAGTHPGGGSRRKLLTAAGVAVFVAAASISALLMFGHDPAAPQAAAAPPRSVALPARHASSRHTSGGHDAGADSARGPRPALSDGVDAPRGAGSADAGAPRGASRSDPRGRGAAERSGSPRAPSCPSTIQSRPESRL